MTAVAHVMFRGGNFPEAAAEMHRGGARAFHRFPRNGTVQRVVHFENARAVTVFRESARVTRRKAPARHAQQLVRRDVAKNYVVIGECRQIFDARGSLHRAAERCEMAAQSIRDGLRAAARNRPARSVCGGSENNAEGRAKRLVKAQEGMRRQPREERLGALAAKKMRQNFRGRKSREPKTCQQKWMAREYMQRLQNFPGEISPALGERLRQAAPALAVLAERRFGIAEIALEHHRGAVIQRMRERRRRMNPLEAVALQRKRRKKWRARSQRVHRGPKIVQKARLRKLQRARRTAGLRLGLKNIHAH